MVKALLITKASNLKLKKLKNLTTSPFPFGKADDKQGGIFRCVTLLGRVTPTRDREPGLP